MKRIGFTLVEVIITIILSAMLVLTASISLKIYLKSIEKSHEFPPEHEARLIRLQYLLSSIFPFVYKEKNDFFLFFQGDKHYMEFITLYTPTRTEEIQPWIGKLYFSKACLVYEFTKLYQSNINPINLDYTKANWVRYEIFCNLLDVEFKYNFKGKTYTKINGVIPSEILISIVLPKETESKKIQLLISLPDTGKEKLELTKTLSKRKE